MNELLPFFAALGAHLGGAVTADDSEAGPSGGVAAKTAAATIRAKPRAPTHIWR